MKVAIGTWGSGIRLKMNCRLLLRLVSLCGLLLLLLPGCSEGDERRHPLFIQGQKAREDNDPETAVAHFKALWKRRPHAVYLHLELAEIYDEMLNDPLKALLHYELYLEQMPDPSGKDTILKWQAQAEKQLFKSLQEKFAAENPPVPAPAAAAEPTSETPETPAAPAEPAVATPETAAVPAPQVPAAPTPETAALQQQLAATRQQLEQYKVRIDLMRAEVARLRKAANIDPMRGRRPQPATPAAGVRTYTVQSGDNPGSIARKFYGKSSLYPLILRANPKVNARNLRPGMVLEIPPLQP